MAMTDDAGPGEADGARLLDSVRGAFLDYPDLGTRPHVTADQWNGLSAAEKRAYRDVAITGWLAKVEYERIDF